ncbi:caspase Dronc [Condylostylus longicornis]|uniref:caspase Dronc n=1 Tax=Condylostylus longicornis TaxID=2530218 RepID=UPI00244E1895|nr:caspase Dronc [Condylostylus longicornis]
MEECHRKVILTNIDLLIAHTKYKELMEACVKNGLLSHIMRKNIEVGQNDEVLKHRRLLEKVTRRGPDAYNKFVEVLQQLNYSNAAKIVRPGEHSGTMTSIKQKKLEKQASIKENNCISNNEKNTNNFNSDGCIISQMDIDEKDGYSKDLRPYSREISSVNQNVVAKCTSSPQHIVNRSKIKIYQMVSKQRGVFFCVNIINFRYKNQYKRSGAEIDGQSLLHLFKELGYSLFYYEDLTAAEFFSLLKKLLDSDYVKNVDSFVMALMSHGEMVDKITDRVEFSDSSTVTVNNILELFRNDTCATLAKKPKVFIFPFCRGAISDLGTKDVQTDSISYNVATFTDILICYATVPGYKTHRDPDSGSWYIQKLCQVFASHAFDTHIEDLLKLVGEAAGQIRTNDGKMQTASYSSYGFHKKLFFNPGYYEYE